MATEAELQFTQDVWAYGSSDDVWTAIFEPARSRFFDDVEGDLDYVEVAGELLAKIERTPVFAVGDMTHAEVVSAILRRFPILGPNPSFGA